VGENVLGIANWNGGLVFDEMQADLEAEGYEVQPYVLPAVAVDAPHRRDRVWFVAYLQSNGCALRQTIDKWGKQKQKNRDEIWDIFIANGELRDAADSHGIRLEQCEDSGEMGGGQAEMAGQRDKPSDAIEADGKAANAADTDNEGLERQTSQRIQTRQGGGNAIQNAEFMRLCGKNGRTDWQTFPTQSPICGRDDGLPTQLDGISFSKWRNESIKGFGNAVVPQVVFQIFKAIELYEQQRTNQMGDMDAPEGRMHGMEKQQPGGEGEEVYRQEGSAGHHRI
jgi:DNA (cytosine-5)-methyltransferase 1